MDLRYGNSQNWGIRLWSILAMLALLVMEVTLSSLWYQALFWPLGIPWAMIFSILFVILGVSFALVRGMEALGWRTLVRQSVFVVWVIAAIFGSLKLLLYSAANIGLIELISLPVNFIRTLSETDSASFFHLIWIALIIWRGVALAHGQTTLTGTQASFQLGLALVLVYGMLFAPLHPIEASVGLYVFLFCGLVGMSAARISNLSELRGGRVPRFGAGWMLSIVFAGLATVGLAILAGWLISGRISQVLATIVLILLAILTALVLLLLSPLLVALARLIPTLAEFLQQLVARFASLPFIAQLQQLITNISSVMDKVIPVLIAGRGLLLAGILIGLLLIILLALRLRRIRLELIAEEESGSAAPEGNNNLLQKMLKRFLQDVRGLRLRGPAQILAAARIRQIYRQLMALSQKMGAARAPSVTPLEFLPELETLFLGEDTELNLITRAYLKIRYGQYPETRQEVREVEAAWEQIRRKGRRIISGRGKKK